LACSRVDRLRCEHVDNKDKQMMQLETVLEEHSLPGSRRQTKEEMTTTLEVNLTWNGALMNPADRCSAFVETCNNLWPWSVLGWSQVPVTLPCMALGATTQLQACPAMAS
jgi:hypothetical protein